MNIQYISVYMYLCIHDVIYTLYIHVYTHIIYTKVYIMYIYIYNKNTNVYLMFPFFDTQTSG
jgi:hypothetical protein